MNNDLYKIVETLCKFIIIPSIYVCVFCLAVIFLSSFIYNVLLFMGFKAEFEFLMLLITAIIPIFATGIWIESVANEYE